MKKLVFVPIATMLMFSACSNGNAKTNNQNTSVSSSESNTSSESTKTDASVSKDSIKVTDGDTEASISSKGIDVKTGDENVTISGDNGIDVNAKDANVSIKDGNVSVSDGSGNGVSISKDGINISSNDGNVNIDIDLKKYVLDDSKLSLIKKGMTYDEMVKAVGISPFNPANLDTSKGEVEVSYFNSDLDATTINFVDGVVDSITK